MNQTNPEVSNAFGTEILQPRTVAQILFNLSALGLINVGLRPELTIVFFDHYVGKNDSTVDFHCALDVDKYTLPVFTEILRNSYDRPFSKTYLRYGEVLEMACKSVDCVYIGDVQQHKYTIHLNIPGLYNKVIEAAKGKPADSNGLKYESEKERLW